MTFYLYLSLLRYFQIPAKIFRICDNFLGISQGVISNFLRWSDISESPIQVFRVQLDFY